MKYYGIKTPQLRSLFQTFYGSRMASQATHVQIYAAYRLMEGAYMEEKSAAVMLLVKNLKHLSDGHVEELGKLVDGHVHEWATCDSLSSKVVNLMIKRNNKVASAVAAWKDSRSIWRLRCCCVSFVKVARFAKHNAMIFDICSTCVRHQERFVQLGVGWLLRELSLAAQPSVISFIKQNYESFTREGLRYAIEKMPKELRTELLGYQKPSRSKSSGASSSSSSASFAANAAAATAAIAAEQQHQHQLQLQQQQMMAAPVPIRGALPQAQAIAEFTALESVMQQPAPPPPPQQQPPPPMARGPSPSPALRVRPLSRSTSPAPAIAAVTAAGAPTSVSASALAAAAVLQPVPAPPPLPQLPLPLPPPSGISVEQYQQAMMSRSPFRVAGARSPNFLSPQTAHSQSQPNLSPTRFHPYQLQQQTLARQLSAQQQLFAQHQAVAQRLFYARSQSPSPPTAGHMSPPPFHPQGHFPPTAGGSTE